MPAKTFTIPAELMERLRANGANRHTRGHDPAPVVKLFTPDAQATWLLTEVDPEDSDYAFGLCDLGLGFPELGYVDLGEVRELRGRFGLPVERDLHFHTDKPLSAWAEAAHAASRIVTP